MNVYTVPAYKWWDWRGLGQAADIASTMTANIALEAAASSANASLAQNQQIAPTMPTDCSTLWNRLFSSSCTLGGQTKRQATDLPTPTTTIAQGQAGASLMVTGPAGSTPPTCASCTPWQIANAQPANQPDAQGNVVWYFPQDPNATMAQIQQQAVNFVQSQPVLPTNEAGQVCDPTCSGFASLWPTALGGCVACPPGNCDPACTWPKSWLPTAMGGCVSCTNAGTWAIVAVAALAGLFVLGWAAKPTINVGRSR